MRLRKKDLMEVCIQTSWISILACIAIIGLAVVLQTSNPSLYVEIAFMFFGIWIMSEYIMIEFELNPKSWYLKLLGGRT